MIDGRQTDVQVMVCLLTLVVVPCQVFLVNIEVVISVKLPELAVDDIKMFIGEVLRQLVHIFLLLQQRHILPSTVCFGHF